MLIDSKGRVNSSAQNNLEINFIVLLQRRNYRAVCCNFRTGLLNGNSKAKDCSGCLEDNRCAVVTQKLLDLSSATFDLQSVVSMEILESDLAYVEARNEEVQFTVCYLTFNVSNTRQTSVPSHAFARMCISHCLCLEKLSYKG